MPPFMPSRALLLRGRLRAFHTLVFRMALVALAPRLPIPSDPLPPPLSHLPPRPTPPQVAQAIRILSLKQAGLSPDCGPAGPLGYSAYAARLVGSAPACTDARLLIRRAVRATLAALPPRARVAEAEALHLLIRHHCNTFGLSGMAGELAREAFPPAAGSVAGAGFAVR